MTGGHYFTTKNDPRSILYRGHYPSLHRTKDDKKNLLWLSSSGELKTKNNTKTLKSRNDVRCVYRKLENPNKTRSIIMMNLFFNLPFLF